MVSGILPQTLMALSLLALFIKMEFYLNRPNSGPVMSNDYGMELPVLVF